MMDIDHRSEWRSTLTSLTSVMSRLGLDDNLIAVNIDRQTCWTIEKKGSIKKFDRKITLSFQTT